MARISAVKVIDRYAALYPSAIKCFQEDSEAFIQQVAFPAGQQKHIITTYLLERAFVEKKRRTRRIEK
jgi:transposase-like protein